MDKICCFTGHRKIYDDEDELYFKVKDQIIRLVKEGYTEFRCGGALGFDTLAADAVISVRQDYPHIKFVMYIPCLDQSKNFPPEQKEHYYAHTQAANRIMCLSKTYYNGCMLDRNKAMVDGSETCIAYLRQNRGGTAFTVRYAESKNCEIIHI